MNAFKLTLAAAAATLALTSAAHAEAPALAFNVGAATDYVFRGGSQTMEDPQVFGGVDATMGLFYAGVWASNVDFGPADSTDAEYDLYVGVKPTLGAVTLDFAAIRYGYISAPNNANYDYWEFKGAASFAAGPATLGVAAYYSPDFFGGATSDDDALYYEANAAIAVPNTKLSISGALGHQEVSYAGGDYTTWNIGAGYAITDHIGVDVRYHDTDAHRFGKNYDDRFVATLKATF